MKFHLAFLFLFSFLITTPTLSQTSEGTEFWFGFMEHRNENQSSKVAMITSKVNTSGTISMPRKNWSQNFTVQANQVTVITLPIDSEAIGSETIQNKGIVIKSVEKVSVYIHQFFQYRAEASIVLPKSTIGNSYYTMSYNAFESRGVIYPSEFMIVANEDDTEVFITPSDLTLKGKSAGNTFSVTLQKGEVYQVQSKANNDDLTGSFITSEKNFSLFSGNRWTQVPHTCGTRDNLLEQMFPLSTWGKRFVTAPNDKVDYDIFRILASQNNTTVIVQGATNRTSTIDAGEYFEYRQSSGSFIIADKPIMVAQFMVGKDCSGYGLGDPAMVILNSVEQIRDTVTLYNSSFQFIEENYINVITKTADLDLTYFDGQLLEDLGAQIETVGEDEEFSFARVQVSSGAHTIYSEGCGVIATAYGYGFAESYAYSGGASFSRLNSNPIPDGGCLNDTIFFDTGLSPMRFDFLWDLGDGNSSNLTKFTHSYSKLGIYPVELIVIDKCLNSRDTLNKELLVSLRQAVEALPDETLCEGNSFTMGATDVPDASYQWTGPLDYFSEEQFPIINNAQAEMSGSYEVIGIISGCATFPAFTQIEVIPPPTPDLGADSVICTDNQISNTLFPGNYSQYEWQDGSTQSRYVVREEGVFTVIVWDENNCMGSDSVRLIEQCPTKVYVPNAFSPNSDGINDYFGPIASDIISIHFSIFDRWGALVFETNDPDIHWDGNFRNKAMNSGVYVWLLQIEGYAADGTNFSETKSGSVTLMR